MDPITIEFEVFFDANLPIVPLKIGDKMISVENVRRRIKSTAKDKAVLEYLENYAKKKKKHVLFLTRDRKFCESAGYRPHPLVSIIVLQEYENAAPEVLRIGNMESSALIETVKKIFTYVLINNPFPSTI